MVSDWQTTTLGNVVELKRGYDLPTKSRQPGPYPVVSSSGPSDTHAEFKAKSPGVVTGRYGTIGEVYYITTDYWPLNTALYVKDFKGNNPRFVSYFLRGIDFVAYSDKSAVPGVNRNHLHQAKVIVPPIPVQQRIADVLGKLDDKIELNRRMNRTLEKMAAAIFKSWFIDFDPVQAKAEGRDPNLPAEIADLFPDAFEDSDLGSIPKGWDCSTVGDEFSLTMGQSPPGETYNESREGTPFFQGRRDFGFRFPTNRVYCTAPTRFAARGDTLMSVRAPVGDVNMAIDRCSVGRGVAAARHKSTSISYTYYAFRSLRDRFEVYNGEGTVFGSISQKDLRAIPWLAPDDSVVSRFDQMAGPIDQRIELNEVQNRRLAGLRDTLLPKLLSGEIELPEAEAIAEEVAS